MKILEIIQKSEKNCGDLKVCHEGWDEDTFFIPIKYHFTQNTWQGELYKKGKMINAMACFNESGDWHEYKEPEIENNPTKEEIENINLYAGVSRLHKNILMAHVVSGVLSQYRVDDYHDTEQIVDYSERIVDEILKRTRE